MDTRDARGGVLVLGGGFAGAYVARLLGGQGATIVSPENFMLFTPLLPEAASGTLEPRHCVVPLRVAELGSLRQSEGLGKQQP
jgi:NADH:quinone reductase (non-electrogenic)